MENAYVPLVIEQVPGGGERSYDIFSRLLKDRIIMLTTTFNDAMASSIISQLLFLDNDKKEPIHMYINSPGGEVYAGLSIYSVMQHISSPVYTYAMGMAASMGSFIANAGEAEHRYILPEATTMIHRVSSGTQGTRGSVHIQREQKVDIDRSFEESERLNNRLTELYAKHNSKGKTFDELYEIMKYDTYLSAQDSVDFGVADKILIKE